MSWTQCDKDKTFIKVPDETQMTEEDYVTDLIGTEVGMIENKTVGLSLYSASKAHSTQHKK
jgi:hypothetical protein